MLINQVNLMFQLNQLHQFHGFMTLIQHQIHLCKLKVHSKMNKLHLKNKQNLNFPKENLVLILAVIFLAKLNQTYTTVLKDAELNQLNVFMNVFMKNVMI